MIKLKVFEHTEAIHAAFWSNAYESAVGQPAQSCADKIAERIAQARLF